MSGIGKAATSFTSGGISLISQETSEALALAVIEDLISFDRLANGEFREALEAADPWLQFPHSSGRGSRLAGPRTRECLRELTKRALQSDRLSERANFGEAFRFLKERFAKTFIADQVAICPDSVEDLMKSTANYSRSRLSNWEVWLPVRFAFQTDDVRILLGDVELLPAKFLFRQLHGEIRHYISGASPQDRELQKRQVVDAIEYYKNYKWAARVQIYGCDAKTIRLAAEDTLLSALDCLHVAFGRKISSRLRVGSLAVSHAQSSTVLRRDGGPAEIWWSRGTLDVLGLPDNWADWLADTDLNHLLKLSGVALEAKSRFESERTLAARYLECARWFGEAVRDDAPFSKIVKYITAIERGVVAGSRSSLKTTVATRVSDLLYTTLEGVSWHQTFEDVRNAYRLRSDLVHGTVSPFDDSVKAGVANCGELAENTLRVLLFRLSAQLTDTKISERDYASWFSEIRDYSQRLIERDSRLGGAET